MLGIWEFQTCHGSRWCQVADETWYWLSENKRAKKLGAKKSLEVLGSKREI